MGNYDWFLIILTWKVVQRSQSNSDKEIPDSIINGQSIEMAEGDCWNFWTLEFLMPTMNNYPHLLLDE